MKKILVLVASHLAVLLAGFVLGIYLLPILTAPAAPSAAQVQAAASPASFKGSFRRDLAGSDLLHWGEGEVSVGRHAIALMGRVAPGPDYKLYLVPEFVENEAQFLRIKSRSQRVGDIKTFENFIVPVPEDVDVAQYTTVLVWCETFSEFISAAKYR
ncbi:MAG: DM13 domain-containing protein [Polaromonas sp.]|uniref:DM13 domain-containing protein n=1 Tax=Polaromonas sp. TaxID=1869339 RepID=UPI002737682A|nr:DM13 domain-containing protein [Polaromonas sp.]MDP3246499.1 DM13 domain-containing protein [Polaromonas sp.]